MNKILLTTLSAASIAGSLAAATTDFESFTLGDVNGQTSDGTDWNNLFGNDAQVVAYDGGQALQVAPDFGGTTWIPDAADLGFTFDNSASVVTFSFDIARTADAGNVETLSINLTDSNAANEYLAFDFWGMGDGLAVYTNTGASGTAGNSVQSGGISMPTASTGYLNVSGTIDFSSNELTSFTIGGSEQLGSAVALGGIADTGSTLGLYVISPGSATQTMYLDNISITAVPEPSSYALIAGSLALGWIMLRRRK